MPSECEILVTVLGKNYFLVLCCLTKESVGLLAIDQMTWNHILLIGPVLDYSMRLLRLLYSAHFDAGK
jgi:hypothetical protein